MTNKLTVDKEFMQLIPPLQEEEYQQLKQNILSKRKCLNAIILWDGIIIDGHNRFYICIEHGIEFEVKDMHFDSREDAKLWILENQLGRRNLTDAARIELAMAKSELLRAKAKERQSLAGGDKFGNEALLAKSSLATEDRINVRKSVAGEANISERTVSTYKQIKEQGSPELLEAVKNGKLKIGTAYRLLPKELEKQLKEAEEMVRYIKKHLPLVKGKEMKAELNEQFSNLAQQLRTLLDEEDPHEVKN